MTPQERTIYLPPGIARFTVFGGGRVTPSNVTTHPSTSILGAFVVVLALIHHRELTARTTLVFVTC